MDVVNLFADEWDREVEGGGQRFTVRLVGQPLGGELLGACLYELPPGERHFPYHWHHGNEELLIVLAGRPTLRTPDGERTLEPGDVALFKRGPDGAHTLRNDNEAPARFLMASSRVAPEMVDYPDISKVGAMSPYGRVMVRSDSSVDYWEGES